MLALAISFVFGKIALNELKPVKQNVWEAHGILGFAPKIEDALKYMLVLERYRENSTLLQSLPALSTPDGTGKHWHNQDPTGGFFNHNGLLSFVCADKQESLKQNYSTALAKFTADYQEFQKKGLSVAQPISPSPSVDLDQIQRLVYKGEKQGIFGSPGIKVSGLNATVSGQGRFPQTMVLGSHVEPTMKPEKMFSITAQLKDNCFFIIMNPDNLDDPVLRPQYMEVLTDDPGKGEGKGETRVVVDYLDDRKEDVLNIKWEVQPPRQPQQPQPDQLYQQSDTDDDFWSKLCATPGSSISQVLPTDPRQENDGKITPYIYSIGGFKTFSLLARIDKKRFYYWVPTFQQLYLLEEFAKDKDKKGKNFSFAELYNCVMQWQTTNNAVNEKIFKQITDIKNGNFKW